MTMKEILRVLDNGNRFPGDVVAGVDEVGEE